MPHSSEILGLVGYQLAAVVMEELDRLHPGSKERILSAARQSLETAARNSPGGNAPAMLDALADF